jgi:hypothetical protein
VARPQTQTQTLLCAVCRGVFPSPSVAPQNGSLANGHCCSWLQIEQLPRHSGSSPIQPQLPVKQLVRAAVLPSITLTYG